MEFVNVSRWPGRSNVECGNNIKRKRFNCITSSYLPHITALSLTLNWCICSRLSSAPLLWPYLNLRHFTSPQDSLLSSPRLAFLCDNQSSFRLIAAVGCPDLRVPDSMRKQRHGNTVTVSCHGSDLSWQLVCSDNRWVGSYGNCDVGRSTMQFLFVLYVAIYISILCMRMGRLMGNIWGCRGRNNLCFPFIAYRNMCRHNYVAWVVLVFCKC